MSYICEVEKEIVLFKVQYEQYVVEVEEKLQ